MHVQSILKRYTILLMIFAFLPFYAAASDDSLEIRLEPAKVKCLPGIDGIVRSLTPPLWNMLRNDLQSEKLMESVEVKSVAVSAQGLMNRKNGGFVKITLNGPKPEQTRYLLKYALVQKGWKCTEKADGKSAVFCMTPPEMPNGTNIYATVPAGTDSVILTLAPEHAAKSSADLKPDQPAAVTGEMAFPAGTFPHPALRGARQIRFTFFRQEHADGQPRLKGIIRIQEKDPGMAQKIYQEATAFFMMTYQQAASAGKVTARHREMFQTRLNGGAAEIHLLLDAETARAFFDLLGRSLRNELK